MLSTLQTLMIFPGASSQGQETAILPPSSDYELRTLTSPTEQKITALFGPALTPSGAPHPAASSLPTILWFYGNGMCLADCSFEFDALRRLGNNVCIPEFLGYGMSEGKPSESSVYDTPPPAWNHLLQRPDIDKSN